MRNKVAQKINDDIVEKISRELNVDKKVVRTCIDVYWKSVNKYIHKFDFLNITKEEYDKIKLKSIWMPKLGSFEMQWKNIMKKRKFQEYVKNKGC